LLSSHAFAEEWIKIQQSNPAGSKVHEMILEMGFSCDFIASNFDKSSLLSSCKETQNPDSEIGLYAFKKTGESYSTNLFFKLGDASNTAFHEFHSPKTVFTHMDSYANNLPEQQIVLVDVKDEGSCYSTEIFGLKGGGFNHLGTIELVAQKYTVHLDTPGYESSLECLGEYGGVSSENGVAIIRFSAPQIYKIDPSQGHLIPQKKNELKYQWSSSKLTRVK